MTGHRRWAPTCLLAGLALVLATAPLFAAGVSLKLNNASLLDAINSLTVQAEIVIDNSAELKDKTVTVNLVDKSIDQALDLMLSGPRIPWWRDASGIYHINSAKPANPATPSTASSSTTPALAALPDLPQLKPYHPVEKIELQSANPADVMRGLGLQPYILDEPAPTRSSGDTGGSPFQPGGSLSPASPFSVQSQEGAVTIQGANGYGSLPTSFPSPTEAGSSFATLGGDNGASPSSAGDKNLDGSSAFHRAPPTSDLFDSSGQYPGQYPFRPGGRIPGYNPRPPFGQPGVQQGVPGTTGTPGATGARGFVPEGIDLVAGLLSDNSLLVQGDPDAIEQLRDIVRMLDIAPQQVAIKAELITVNSSLMKEFGSSFNFTSNIANVAANSGSPLNGLNVDILRGNLQAVLGAIEGSGKGKVITSPMVTTMNNIPAAVTQSLQTPVFIPQTIATNAGIQTISYPFPVSTTTGLLVTPRVNRDGSITLSIQPQVSGVTRFITGPDGSEVPEINQTGTSPIIRRVQSGQTVVIAGLTTETQSLTETRIPILSNIPIIGRLFRHRSRNESNSQLLIFVTPYLVGETSEESQSITP